MVSTKMGGREEAGSVPQAITLLISELKDLKNSHVLPKSSGLVFSAVYNFDLIIGEILFSFNEEVSLGI